MEVGLGTGLNAYLTLVEAYNKKASRINYTAIEPYPLQSDIVNQLNYTTLIGGAFTAKYFSDIHSSAFENTIDLLPNFQFTKHNCLLSEMVFNNQFDIIYFDAFSPNVQPELWTKAVFEKLYQAMKPNSILVTYCAKGEVKRNLKSVGFIVESLPGPPGKREMVRAICV